MLVEDMEAVTVNTTVANLASMLWRPMLRANRLVFVFAADVVTILQGTRGMQDARITPLAAVTGEAVVTGEVVDTGAVVIGIRTMDIPGLAITAWATAIHITGITVTHITDIILIATDTGPIGA
jgi:hypothetical protein